MRICVAQVRPFKGDIEKNIVMHKRLIDVAVWHSSDLVVFPELSLTGYEPKLAGKLATDQNDKRLDDFQIISDTKQVTIGVGVPTRGNSGVQISMVIFQPEQARKTYSKQHLHSDELPYFVNGQQQVVLTMDDKKVAPAICYESLVPEHAENAFNAGVEIYMASVAKSANGVAKAFRHYPAIAKQYAMTVLMANCVGLCDDFEGVGKSSIWNRNSSLLGQLDETNEGILIYDTETEETIEWKDK